MKTTEMLKASQNILEACAIVSEIRNKDTHVFKGYSYIETNGATIAEGNIQVKWNVTRSSCGQCEAEYDYDYFSFQTIETAVEYQAKDNISLVDALLHILEHKES